MDITKIVDKTKISEAHVGAASSAKTKGVKSETVDANNASSKAASVSFPGAEKVTWSEDAELASQALHEAKATPDVRAEKVALLKAAIKNGIYKVDSGKIAEKMIQSSLEEDLLTKKA